MSKKDYYQILGLAKTATEDEIKQAYRKCAMKFHPDRNKTTGAEDSFKEAKDAYEHLSDPVKRKEYDMYGHMDNAMPHNHQQRNYSHNTQNSFNDNDALKDLFKEYFSKNTTSGVDDNIFRNARHDTTIVINISLEDAYKGKTLRIDQSTTLTVPAGIRTGTKLYANNKLYQINIQLHNKYKRSNDDLLVDVEINAIEAILGVDAVFDHLDNSKLQFTIPAGIQPGQVIRLANKGMKNPEFDKYGDILVRIAISIPKSLSDSHKTALKAMGYRATINI